MDDVDGGNNHEVFSVAKQETLIQGVECTVWVQRSK